MSLTDKDIEICPCYDNLYTGIYVSYCYYPCNHAYIELSLESTATLDTMADKDGKEYGYMPLFDTSGEYDDNGWYDFTIEVYERGDHLKTDVVGIRAERCNTDDNDGDYFDLELSADDIAFLYRYVDKYLIDNYGKCIQDYFREEHAESVS